MEEYFICTRDKQQAINSVEFPSAVECKTYCFTSFMASKNYLQIHSHNKRNNNYKTVTLLRVFNVNNLSLSKGHFLEL